MTIAQTDLRSDFELVTATREGSTDAFAELWKRHSRAATNFAITLRDLADPDDLVSEAYIRVLTAIRAGGGPSGVFRAYLLTAVRNTALNWGRTKQKEIGHEDFDVFLGSDSAEELTLQELERSTTSRAFKSLPPRYQEALWYAEVENIPRAEIATILGIKANAVSQLTFRARDALRTAWLQEHINRDDLEPECAAIVGLIAGYVRDTINRRQRKLVDAHARECAGCLLAIDEVDHLAKRLTFVLLPLAVGITGAAAYQALIPSGAASAEVLTASSTGGKAASTSASSAPHVGVAVLVGAGTVAVVAIAAAFAAGLSAPANASAHHDNSSTAATSEPVKATPPSPKAAPRHASPVIVKQFALSPGATVHPNTPVARPSVPVSAPSHSTAPGSSSASTAASNPAPPSVPVAAPSPSPTSTPATGPSSSGSATPPADTAPLAPLVTWTIDPAGWLLPSATGTADPGATVQIMVDGSVAVSTVAGADGAWSIASIPLTSGTHQLSALQVTVAGVTSVPTASVPVTLQQPAGAAVRLNDNLTDAWISTPFGMHVVLADPACNLVHNGDATTTWIHCQGLPLEGATIPYYLAADAAVGEAGPAMEIVVPDIGAQPDQSPTSAPDTNQ